MEAWRKRIKKYAFLNKNGSMWTAENEAKTLVWSKIFCVVFVETKTDNRFFENALQLYCDRDLHIVTLLGASNRL